jgi:hypothetical protein
MHLQLQKRIATIYHKEPISWRKIDRGYTPAERWVVTFSDRSSAFAKIGTTPLTASWLRAEYSWYPQLSGDFLPALYGFEDDPAQPILLLEDLSSAYWPPPWRPEDLSLLQRTLHQIASTRPLPNGLTSLESIRDLICGWSEVAKDPAPFLSLGFCSESWLTAALPMLLEAQAQAQLDGDDLLHGDARSDNLCILGQRMIFVDWNNPLRGNGCFELATIAPSLRLEGGPLPEEFLPDAGPMAAVVSGFFAARAGLPDIPDAPKVRWIQRRQLCIALPWAARALRLPPLDLNWARQAQAKVEADFAAAKLDEATRFQQLEESLTDSYLSSADPRAQSGKSGDEDEWRWSRELILDALPEGGSLLDVGCANGYLMESVHRWGQERDITVEPYGLDISWRLVSLAQRRLPHWSERIWVGNIVDWAPPRRFDLVHTGLDYVPGAQRRRLLERLLQDFLIPGGQLVLRAERVQDNTPDLVAQITQLGFSVNRVLEAKHSGTGAIRRTVCLKAKS